MCYSGECLFEVGGGDRIGDCIIYDHSKFLEEYGLSPCLVGGVIIDAYDEVTFELNRKRIEEIRREVF